MTREIEIQFKVGDTVWRKDLLTNESYETKIRKINAYYFIEEDGSESYCVMYMDGDGPMCNMPDKLSANSAFATKEEADACPAYDPNKNLWDFKNKKQ